MRANESIIPELEEPDGVETSRSSDEKGDEDNNIMAYQLLTVNSESGIRVRVRVYGSKAIAGRLVIVKKLLQPRPNSFDIDGDIDTVVVTDFLL